MARKDNILRAFLSNEEFCDKFEIPINLDITINEAKKSEIPVVRALSIIIDKENESYAEVIAYLNDTL